MLIKDKEAELKHVQETGLKAADAWTRDFERYGRLHPMKQSEFNAWFEYDERQKKYVPLLEHAKKFEDYNIDFDKDIIKPTELQKSKAEKKMKEIQENSKVSKEKGKPKKRGRR